MNYGDCIDFTFSLENRLTKIEQLTIDEKETLLEHICSSYMIHPTFVALQYLQHLILRTDFSLQRRIRVAEMCDLGLMSLYLITCISGSHERIACIEQFTNPYLKIHAYCVLYANMGINNTELYIQILKNLYPLPGIRKEWIIQEFVRIMKDESLEYKHRSNCADAILHRSKDRNQLTQARQILGIQQINGDLYTHKENVHLFIPKIKLIDQIFTELESTSIETINEYIQTHKSYPLEFFQQRIWNDKTIIGNNYTLGIILSKVWTSLTDDLRSLLLDDLYSFQNTEDEWMCTTGYYNRMLNVYQTLIKDTLFDLEDAFSQTLTRKINACLYESEEKDDILLELPQSSEENRMRYLTFKVHSLPNIIKQLRDEFSDLTSQQFDDYFSTALRRYEDSL